MYNPIAGYRSIYTLCNAVQSFSSCLYNALPGISTIASTLFIDAISRHHLKEEKVFRALDTEERLKIDLSLIGAPEGQPPAPTVFPRLFQFFQPANTSYDTSYQRWHRQCPSDGLSGPRVLHLSVTPDGDENGAMLIPDPTQQQDKNRPDIPDWNRLLELTHPLFRTISHPSEICLAIEQAASQGVIDELVIHAHGTPHEIRWPRQAFRVGDLLPSTEQGSCFSGLASHARIILASCSTGSLGHRDHRYPSISEDRTKHQLAPQRHTYIEGGGLQQLCTWNIAQWIAHLAQKTVIAPDGPTASPPVLIPFTNHSYSIELCKYEDLGGLMSCKTKVFYPENPSRDCVTLPGLYWNVTVTQTHPCSLFCVDLIYAIGCARAAAFLCQTTGTLGQRVLSRSTKAHRAFEWIHSLGETVGHLLDQPLVSMVQRITAQVRHRLQQSQ